MRPPLRPLVAALVALAVWAGGCGSDEAAIEQAAPLAPLEGLDRLDGETHSVEEGAPAPTVVWFWAPWCPNCRAMGPDVAALAAEYGDRVTFVGVAGRGERGDMDEFVSDTGTGGFGHTIDADGSVWAAFGVVSQPALAFVDPHGEVELVVGRQSREAMERRLDRLVGS